MIRQDNHLRLNESWRFGLVPLAAKQLRAASEIQAQTFDIDGRAVTCMRSFHEEVAADFFFASHYNCDPDAPLVYLDAPVEGEQVVIWWHDADIMAAEELDDWQAVLCMFRAAMATLHPQGRYLRLVFPTEKPELLQEALRYAFAVPTERAGVGFDYETGTSEFDVMHETLTRSNLIGD